MNTPTLPPQFIAYWHRLQQFLRHRGTKAAYRALVSQWRGGAEIPGYANIESANADQLPPGWSYRNLLKYRPSREQLFAARARRIQGSN